MRQVSIAITATIVAFMSCIVGLARAENPTQADATKQGGSNGRLGEPEKTSGDCGFGCSAIVSERALNLLLLPEVQRNLGVNEEQAKQARELAAWPTAECYRTKFVIATPTDQCATKPESSMTSSTGSFSKSWPRFSIPGSFTD